MHSQALPQPVAAHLKAIDLAQGVFELSAFAYLKGEWKPRLEERVQPKKPIYVSLLYKQKSYRTYLENISVNGMKLLVNRSIRGTHIQAGSSVYLDFQLPSTNRWFHLKGRVVYLQEIDYLLTSMGLRLYSKGGDAGFLEKYVADRKGEIQAELDQSFGKACELPGVERQFF